MNLQGRGGDPSWDCDAAGQRSVQEKVDVEAVGCCVCVSVVLACLVARGVTRGQHCASVDMGDNVAEHAYSGNRTDGNLTQLKSI